MVLNASRGCQEGTKPRSVSTFEGQLIAYSRLSGNAPAITCFAILTSNRNASAVLNPALSRKADKFVIFWKRQLPNNAWVAVAEDLGECIPFYYYITPYLAALSHIAEEKVVLYHLGYVGSYHTALTAV